MAVELMIEPDVEARLTEVAAASGMTPGVYAGQMITTALGGSKTNHLHARKEDLEIFLKRIAWNRELPKAAHTEMYDREMLYADEQ